MLLNIGCGKVLIPGWVNVDALGGNIKGDIRNLPFRDDTFDGALASHVLEHIIDCQSAMQELHRVLKPNSHLLIHVPYGINGLFDPFHMRAFNFSTLRRFEHDDEQSLECKRLFEIEKMGITDYVIPFEWYIRRVGLMKFFPQRWYDTHRNINPFPLTKRKEISCTMRTIKST